MGIFILVPFLDVIRRSFFHNVQQQFCGFDNYQTVLENKAFALAAKNTLRFVGYCIPLLLVLSLLTAVFLSRNKKTGVFLKSVFLIPMAVPVASVVLLWRLLFDSHGLVNAFLAVFSLEPVNWMGSRAAFWILVFSYIWKNLGYDVVLWMAGLAGIPDSIYEAARVDGAGEWKCFTKITLPNLLPSLFTISVLSLLNSFKVFREAYLVAGDYPQESMYLLQHLLNNWFRELDFDKMAAASVLNSCIIFLLILFLSHTWEEKEGV